MKRKESGLSLVEVLIASSLLALVSYGVMNVLKQTKTTIVTAETGSEMVMITSEIISILANTKSCTATLGGKNAANTPAGTIKKVVLVKPDSQTIDKFKVIGDDPNARYGQGRIKILDYRLTDSPSDVSLSDNTTALLVRFLRGKAAAKEEGTKKIRIWTKRVGNIIESCRALSMVENSIWKRSAPPNENNIYYNEGNVGVGIDSPSEIFHVKGDSAASKVLFEDVLFRMRSTKNSEPPSMEFFIQGDPSMDPIKQKWTKIKLDNRGGTCENGIQITTSSQPTKYFSYHDGQVEIVGGHPGMGPNTCVPGLGQNVILSVKNPNTVVGSNANLGLRTMAVGMGSTSIQFSDGDNGDTDSEWDGNIAYTHGSSSEEDLFRINVGGGSSESTGASVGVKQGSFAYKSRGDSTVLTLHKKDQDLTSDNGAGMIYEGDELSFFVGSLSDRPIAFIKDGLKKEGTDPIIIEGDLEVTENITVNVGEANGTSDRRLKKNIQTLSSVTKKVLDLKSVSFHWKDESPTDDKTQATLGLIAQELEKIFPELVSEGRDGMNKVSYLELVPILIQAIQEKEISHQRKIKRANKRLEKLERLTYLKKLMHKNKSN